MDASTTHATTFIIYTRNRTFTVAAHKNADLIVSLIRTKYPKAYIRSQDVSYDFELQGRLKKGCPSSYVYPVIALDSLVIGTVKDLEVWLEKSIPLSFDELAEDSVEETSTEVLKSEPIILEDTSFKHIVVKSVEDVKFKEFVEEIPPKPAPSLSVAANLMETTEVVGRTIGKIFTGISSFFTSTPKLPPGEYEEVAIIKREWHRDQERILRFYPDVFVRLHPRDMPPAGKVRASTPYTSVIEVLINDENLLTIVWLDEKKNKIFNHFRGDMGTFRKIITILSSHRVEVPIRLYHATDVDGLPPKPKA